jgi:hypothetical protein
VLCRLHNLERREGNGSSYLFFFGLAVGYRQHVFDITGFIAETQLPCRCPQMDPRGLASGTPLLLWLRQLELHQSSAPTSPANEMVYARNVGPRIRSSEDHEEERAEPRPSARIRISEERPARLALSDSELARRTPAECAAAGKRHPMPAGRERSVRPAVLAAVATMASAALSPP